MKKNIVFLSILFAFVNSSFASGAKGICEGKSTDVALVMAIDVSGSLNPLEMDTQINGYISALQDPAVMNNLLTCQCNEISVVIWADNTSIAFEFDQIDTDEKIEKLVGVLEEIKASKTTLASTMGYQTFLSQGIERSAEVLAARTEPARRKIINISSDGFESRLDDGTLGKMRSVKQSLEQDNVVINGLPILVYDFIEESKSSNAFGALAQGSTQMSSGNGYDDLADFYRKEVITRYGYVEKAEEYVDFGRAVKSSLLRDTCALMM